LKVATQELETAFSEHLRQIQPNTQMLAALPKAAAQMWAERQGDSEAYTKKVTARLDEKKRLKSELLKAKLRGEVSQSDYADANAEFDAEIKSLQQQINGSHSNGLSLDGFMRFVKVMQVNIAEFWELSPAEQRVGVQNLLFKNGLHYVPKSKEFEHPKSCLFGVLAGLSVQNGGLASPTGFEPVLSP